MKLLDLSFNEIGDKGMDLLNLYFNQSINQFFFKKKACVTAITKLLGGKTQLTEVRLQNNK